MASKWHLCWGKERGTVVGGRVFYSILFFIQSFLSMSFSFPPLGTYARQELT